MSTEAIDIRLQHLEKQTDIQRHINDDISSALTDNKLAISEVARMCKENYHKIKNMGANLESLYTTQTKAKGAQDAMDKLRARIKWIIGVLGGVVGIAVSLGIVEYIKFRWFHL
jgi:uncharacterized coiled-coil protein SlyX